MFYVLLKLAMVGMMLHVTGFNFSFLALLKYGNSLGDISRKKREYSR
jgi:hypothetical protein